MVYSRQMVVAVNTETSHNTLPLLDQLYYVTSCIEKRLFINILSPFVHVAVICGRNTSNKTQHI